MEFTTGEIEKRLLASILKQRLMEGKNTITYKELLEEEMPLFLRNFLQNRVKKYCYTDEPFQFKNSKRYDFNYEKIKSLKAQLHKAFEEATLFTDEEITEIINRTVGLQFDLLVSPQKTLVKIFFKNKSERTQAEILQILSGLVDNRVYIKQLTKELKEFDQYHIIKDDFDKLSKQTQQQVFEKDFITAFMSDVKTFLEYVGQINGDEESTISKEILTLFFKERNYNNYAEAFNSIEQEDFVDIQEIPTLLTNHINNNGKDDHFQVDVEDDIEAFLVSSVPTKEYDEFIETEEEEIQIEDNGIDIDKIEIDTGEEEIEKIEQAGTEELEQIETEEIEHVEPEEIERVEIDEKAPIAGTATETKKHFPIIEEYRDPQDIIIDRNTIESQPKGPLVMLQSLIDEKSKKLIQRKIFCKDEIAYNNFIMKLEKIDNWKKAKQIIDDELIIRSVQPFSREALKLGDLVFNRYFPKKS